MTWRAPRTKQWRVAIAIWAVCTLAYLLFATESVRTHHTVGNHFALLAESWLAGRLDLGRPPPDYTGMNDFASYAGRWFVAFPPFPALVLLPFVALAGGAERLPDGLVFLLLAGIGPAVLYLALERMSQLGLSARSLPENLLLTALFAFGSVYFFSVEQGTVWYAAHVVGVALACLYLRASLGAEYPLLAGLALGCGFLTRTPLLLAAPLFLLEAWRRSRNASGDLDRGQFLRRSLPFAVPLLLAVGVFCLLNALRFDGPFDSGYAHLVIRWQGRIARWGLFGYHYLGRNLAVILTSLPWYEPEAGGFAWRINAHGLALWLTTPAFLWLGWPARRSPVQRGLAVTALLVLLPSLFYQNTGWLQFGYRFSNDVAPFLIALLAVGVERFGRRFQVAFAWAIFLNAFGAWTFGRPAFARLYVVESTQSVLHQPD